MDEGIKPRFDLGVDLMDTGTGRVGTVRKIAVDDEIDAVKYELRSLFDTWWCREENVREQSDEERIMSVPVTFSVTMTAYLNIDTGQVDHGRIIMPMKVVVRSAFDGDVFDGQRVPTYREEILAQEVLDDGDWLIITNSNTYLDWES